jgi:hypothetical protein
MTQPGPSNVNIYCSDDELLIYIQHIVEEWFRATYRASFTDMLRAKHPERCPVPCLILDSVQRRLYPQLAAMVRFGEAHSTHNRKPLHALLAAERNKNQSLSQRASAQNETFAESEAV